MMAPEWIKSLIIYEVSTKAFTSPNGPGSGNFDSLRSKLPYLQDLGVTGIWLTGHSLSDPTHFYNIWTQYACIHPGEIDPTLGTDGLFKELIEAAHEVEIKVFLDVITHGVINSSPLIREKPHWFKGGSWGMTDYDWHGGHSDLDDWWINLWVAYVERFGIDGFRLDVAIHRPDLWKRIRERAVEVGHPVVIFPEIGPGFSGVTDFIQWGDRLSDNHGVISDNEMFSDVFSNTKHAIRSETNKAFRVLIEYADGTSASNYDDRPYRIQVEYRGIRESMTNEYQSGNYQRHDIILGITDAPKKTIENIIIEHSENPRIHGGPGGSISWQLKRDIEADFHVTIEYVESSMRLAFPMRCPPGQWLSTQLSCHDNGWEGYDLDSNPYVAQGSRFMFGYSLILSPSIPLFMSGEEFDADFLPLPDLSPKLYDGVNPGKGKWLYGSWIQWDQLTDIRKSEMLDDVKRLIRIRRDNQDLIYPLRVGDMIDHIAPISYDASTKLPRPYLYWNNDKCLLIAGNPHADQDVEIRFNIAFENFGFDSSEKVTMMNLWTEGKKEVMDLHDVNRKQFTIRKDKIHRGGLLILVIEKFIDSR